MPSDYITIHALSSELNALLSQGKIDKIYMPEKDEISLAIRANNTNYNLAVSCNASNPRMHISTTKKLNPVNAPSFCMHLRKHLLGGIIQSIHTINEDRIVCIEILSHNEMRDEVCFKIIVEMMGRYSNIIVVNENWIITDTLKQVAFDTMTKRSLLPSVKYIVPEQNKIALSNTNKISELLNNYMGGSIATLLSNNISGIAKSTAQEIVSFAGLNDNTSQLCDKDINSLINAIDEFANIYGSKYYAPCTSILNGISQEYFVMKYQDVAEYKSFDTLNAAIQDCLAKKDEIARQQERTKFLTKAYNGYLTKCRKNLEKYNQKLGESASKDSYKLFGELIISNLYQIKKGDESCTVTNYYEENQPDIKIKLDSTLSPQQNAQAYFKKYNKLKTAEEIAITQIKEFSEKIEYLKSIETFISRCSTPQEIAEIQLELEKIGALKTTISSKKKDKESLPISFLVKEFVILIGKNNFQNDKLTFKIANGGDLWLHTKKFHGSHAIILTEGRSVPDDVLLVACEICAAYSQCGNETKVEVDYTYRKNVKRHPNKNPGMVLYETYNTLVVMPNSHNEFLTK